MTSIDPSVWLITGSSSGLGLQLAHAARERGDRVVAAARRPQALDELVATAPERVLPVTLDVTRAGDAEAAVDAALDRFGRIDVLVNNAGYGSVGAIEELDLADLRTIMETMFFGAIALTQAALPHLRAQGSGTIVQMSSMGGQLAPPGFGAYCAAKYALEAASEALAAEVAPFGIRVLIVEPGAFRTDFGRARIHRSRAIADYAPSVGPTRAAVDQMDGSQPGDPARAAAAILAALEAPQPPLRLALGDDAFEAIAASLDSRRAELAAWEALSRSTTVPVGL
ncbi:MAG TPA: oxidoreductase [Solirubrobacteraceae bacterium]|jgi:NAD(P)-dependent dehydrogenase (short-subunit alcohol dehydrogenase family)|nr:oxidoreductase [Solirubrobacteraceae bacterium]